MNPKKRKMIKGIKWKETLTVFNFLPGRPFAEHLRESPLHGFLLISDPLPIASDQNHSKEIRDFSLVLIIIAERLESSGSTLSPLVYPSPRL